MAGDLGFLPGRELGVEIFERLRRLGFQAGDFLADGSCTITALECAQLRHLGLELRHRLFKVEITAHPRRFQISRAGKSLTRLGHAIACIFLGDVGLKRLRRRHVALAGGIIVPHSRQAATVKRKGKLWVSP